MVKRRKDNRGRVLKEGEYQRKNLTYEYKWIDNVGKRRSIYAPTLNELRQSQRELIKNSLDGIRYDAKQLTINDAYNQWISVKRGLKEKTRQLYIYMYNHYVLDSIGNAKVTDVRKSDIRAFYNSLHETQGLKIGTVDTIHTVLHQVFELVVDDGYLNKNPATKALTELKSSKNISTKRKTVLDSSQQDLFVKALETDPKLVKWRGIFLVMLYTGMRVGEVTGLTWRDIDFSNNLIYVKRTLAYYDRPSVYKDTNVKSHFGITTPKTRAGERVIPMTKEVTKALLSEKKFQEESGLYCTVKIDGITDFVFLNRFGSVQHQGTLNQALRRIVRQINENQIQQNENNSDANLILIPKFSCHTLRHTFTTNMVEKGLNIKVIQEILGHSDISITLDIYARATEALKRDEMDKM